jgi:hypothetical protein
VLGIDNLFTRWGQGHSITPVNKKKKTYAPSWGPEKFYHVSFKSMINIKKTAEGNPPQRTMAPSFVDPRRQDFNFTEPHVNRRLRAWIRR